LMILEDQKRTEAETKRELNKVFTDARKKN
jgi:hypothetical protein